MSVHVYLYSPGDSAVDAEAVGGYLADLFPSFAVEVRGDFLRHMGGGGACASYATEIASARVSDPAKPFSRSKPMFGEVEYERRVLSGTPSGGVLYDGFELSCICRGMIPRSESGLRHIHVAFTDRLVGTFGLDDLRYHARVIVVSQPSLISTTGIVEAPAKPREYYLAKLVCGSDAVALARLKKQFEGQFIDYGDPRITEVAKGYALQAVFYLLSGEAFCDDPECRLFDAHWQKELIKAQLSGGKLCPRHERLVKRLRRHG